MSKKQAQQIAREYVNAHKERFGKVSKKEIDNAVRQVTQALMLKA